MSTPQEDKQNIGSLFDRIAGTYDQLNHVLSLNIDRTWRRKAIRGMSACESLLDVAVGTADLAIETLRQKKAQRIVGIDLSQEMMAVGEKKTAKLGLNNIEFIQASALDMPFDNDTFEAVTCAYGVRNFSDLEKGLSEMYRVMKSGGELMILEFSYPSNRIIAWFYDLYFSHILPFVGRIVSHDRSAYAYLNRSVKQFIWGEDMCDQIRKVGFADVQFKPLSLGITTIYRAKK